MDRTPALPWHVVVPVKGAVGAKTRLVPPVGVDRGRLAVAMATDTLAVVCRVVAPSRVLVVTGDAAFAAIARSLGTGVVDDPGRGLFPAVAAGLGALDADRHRAVLLADLPALRDEDLTHGLELAGHHDRAFVADRQGTGTTLLTALPGISHAPRFGPGSAALHEGVGYLRLRADLITLRTDVDNSEDLAAALRLTTGPETARLLGPLAG